MLKNSIIYLGSSIFNKAIPFFLLPILTKYLTPSEYGILSMFQLMVSFASAFVGMNMSINISKNFFKYTKKRMATVIGNILIILSCSTILYTFIVAISALFSDYFFSVPTKVIMVIPLISFMLMVNTINLTVLRNQEKAVLFGFFEITNTFVNMGATLVLLVSYNFGWYSWVVGTIVAYSIFFVFTIIYLQKQDLINIKFNRKETNKILKISVPLIPHVLGGIILGLSDRFFIEKMVNLKAVGIYSVGYMFGMIVILFTDAFIKAWSPWFYKTLSNETIEKKIKIVKYSYYYIFATFAVAIVVSVIAKFIIPYVVDERYKGASEYVFWVAIGYAIHGIYKIFFPYVIHVNRTYFLGISTMVAAGLNLVLNFFFIKHFGPIGAAYSTAISFTASAALVFWFQNKHFKMPWLFFMKSV